MCRNMFEKPMHHREIGCEMQPLGSCTEDAICSGRSESPLPERCDRRRHGKPGDVNVASNVAASNVAASNENDSGRNNLERDLDVSGPGRCRTANGGGRGVTLMTSSKSAGSIRERRSKRGRKYPESPTTVVFSPILPVKSTLLALRKLKSTPLTLTLAKLEEKTAEPVSVRNNKPYLRGIRQRPMASLEEDVTNPTAKGAFDDGQNRASRLGSVTRSTTMFFPSGGLSDGITLRLSTLDTFVESWDPTTAPVRALCDIDSSLNHAVINYRGFINGVDAVDGVQQRKASKVIIER